MQVELNKGLGTEAASKIREELGFEEGPVPYDSEKLTAALEHKEVEAVRVFRLKKGMTVDVGGTRYKVTAVRDNGKITLRPFKARKD